MKLPLGTARRSGAALTALSSSASVLLVVASVACNADTEDLFGAGGSGAATASGSTSGSTAQTTTGTASATGGTTTTTGGATTSSGSATCGNGVVDQPNEACDGGDLQGHTCTEQLFSDPAGVACAADCTLDFTACHATCGDSVTEPTEACDDGNTIDTDTCSAKCQQQGDCQAPIQIALPLGTVDVAGQTTGASQVESTTCEKSTGPELVFQVNPVQSGFLTIWTDPAGTSFDTMIYVRQMGCGSNMDVACGDNNFAHPDLVSFPVSAGSSHTVVLDGYDGQLGTFSLHFDLSTGIDCNDPVPILASGDNGFVQRVTGTTVGATPTLQGTCGGAGNDVVYRVTRIAPGPIGVDTEPSAGSSLNSITYAQKVCGGMAPGNELACSGPINDPTSSISVSTTAQQNPIFVVIDAQATQGGYTVDFDPSP